MTDTHPSGTADSTTLASPPTHRLNLEERPTARDYFKHACQSAPAGYQRQNTSVIDPMTCKDEKKPCSSVAGDRRRIKCQKRGKPARPPKRVKLVCV
ncbi:hypothetical protein EVAR_93733_1 [Eumeta japonica]|uniref:Uncharacterized protein n=1 Tax=Eumeta variegata TaxID=151549 RepID=A0A4C1U2W7_EUMVA|nr:hypothetical protein EVAR_93733_1 [Eumeta japonica]